MNPPQAQDPGMWRVRESLQGKAEKIARATGQKVAECLEQLRAGRLWCAIHRWAIRDAKGRCNDCNMKRLHMLNRPEDRAFRLRQKVKDT